MVKQAIQHGCHGRIVAQKFAPVFDRPIRGEERAGPLIPAHDELEEVLRRSAGKLAHSEVVDDEQSSAAIQLGFSKLLQQVMGFAVEDSMTLLLDGCPSDGLSDVTLSRARWSKKESVLLLVDEFRGGELMDKLSIQFLVEVKVEVGECFFGIPKLRLFLSSSNEAVRPTGQLISDESGEKIDRRKLLRLGLE